MRPALTAVVEELRQRRIVDQVEQVVLRRNIGIRDTRRGIDVGVGPHGRCVDNQPAGFHCLTRQIIVGVVAFRRFARDQRKGDVAFGKGIPARPGEAPPVPSTRACTGLGRAQQFVQRGPEADDIGVVARETPVRRAADAVDGPDGLGLGDTESRKAITSRL